MTKQQYLQLLNVAIQTGCSYFTFNIPNTACNDCGYVSKHKLAKCPKCGSNNLDYITRVIGYLKRVSSFSKKQGRQRKKRGIMIMLKYESYFVVFQEVPNEVTLGINVSGCPYKCKGCHSPFLWKDEGIPLLDNLENIIKLYENL